MKTSDSTRTPAEEINPYQAPRSSPDGLAEPVSRRRWIAVPLALVAPAIAMLYLARPLRAVAYFVAASLGPLVAMYLGAMGAGNLVLVLVVLLLLVPAVAAVDAFRLVGRWNRSALPWYSRAPALVVFFAAGWIVPLSMRALAVEPFKIPSGAMEPTLKIADQILVSKLSYGWSIPFGGRRIVRFGEPARGDVAVFRYPGDRKLDYVMRVVALPGDTVAYVDKRLTINGREAGHTDTGEEAVSDAQGTTYRLRRYREDLDHVTHAILIAPDLPTYQAAAVRAFDGKEHCAYHDSGFSCDVPAGRYFVMGDNRDYSSDSRYWGFVPEDDFIGRVFAVWYSWRDPDRAGTEVK